MTAVEDGELLNESCDTLSEAAVAGGCRVVYLCSLGAYTRRNSSSS